jgi:hypothetical protein
MFARVWQAGDMKKQGSDQAFHDRRYQERKREEAARKPTKNKAGGEESGTKRAELDGNGPENKGKA